MKIEIPDEWIARIGGCHPDTPVEQVFKIIRQIYPSATRQFYHRIRQYVVEEAKHEKS